MTSALKSEKAPIKVNEYPFWSPRFWHGMRTGCWWRLLARNGFRIAPSKLPIAVGVSGLTPVNDLLAIAQQLIHGRRIQQTQLNRPPIFILGHWRSGTTFLHELLVSDPRFASPNTFQCFAPSHFILSEYLMVRFGNFLLPKRRPMDNMEAGWNLPQEDEFALMNLGVPSPYLQIAFPRTQPKSLEYLSMSGLSETELRNWSEKLLWFVRALTYHFEGKQLVLKSPPHTGRISHLAKLFPGAKFIHLSRDPRQLFHSTMRLWKSLHAVQALQHTPDEADLKAYVTECLNRMYASFEQSRREVDSDCLAEISYESLVADPSGTLEKLYCDLQLGDFSKVLPLVQDRLKDHGDYRPNKHPVDSQLEEEILLQWQAYTLQYGYQSPTDLPPRADCVSGTHAIR